MLYQQIRVSTMILEYPSKAMLLSENISKYFDHILNTYKSGLDHNVTKILNHIWWTPLATFQQNTK